MVNRLHIFLSFFFLFFFFLFNFSCKQVNGEENDKNHEQKHRFFCYLPFTFFLFFILGI